MSGGFDRWLLGFDAEQVRGLGLANSSRRTFDSLIAEIGSKFGLGAKSSAFIAEGTPRGGERHPRGNANVIIAWIVLASAHTLTGRALRLKASDHITLRSPLQAIANGGCRLQRRLHVAGLKKFLFLL